MPSACTFVQWLPPILILSVDQFTILVQDLLQSINVTALSSTVGKTRGTSCKRIHLASLSICMLPFPLSLFGTSSHDVTWHSIMIGFVTAGSSLNGASVLLCDISSTLDPRFMSERVTIGFKMNKNVGVKATLQGERPAMDDAVALIKDHVPRLLKRMKV